VYTSVISQVTEKGKAAEILVEGTVVVSPNLFYAFAVILIK